MHKNKIMLLFNKLKHIQHKEDISKHSKDEIIQHEFSTANYQDMVSECFRNLR